MKIHNHFRGRSQAVPALLAGIILSCVGIAFNVSHGWALGGSDQLRAGGMALAFLGCILLKDSLLGALAKSIKSGKIGIAVLCLIGLLLGATGSFMAAFGSASEGREEKSDPRAAAMQAFQMAKKTEAEAERRLSEIGTTIPVAQARANVSAALAQIDPGIAKRTAGCTSFPTVDVGPRVQAVNRSTCQPVVEAIANVEISAEADTLRAKLAEARETISRGAPKSADPMADNISAIWKRFTGEGQADVGSILSLLVAVIVEIGAPVAWAIWMLSAPKVAPVATPKITVAEEPATVATPAANDDTDLGNVTEFELAKVAAFFRSDIEPAGGPGGGGRVIRPRRWQRDEVRADLTERLNRGENWPSQRSMASTYGVPTSTLSEWLKHWAEEGEEVRRQRIGRRKMVG